MSETEGDEAERLTRQAVRLFLRLKHDPDNVSILRDRDEFLARGAAERDAWNRAERAASALPRRRGRGGGATTALIVAALVGTILATAASYRPIRLAMLADAWTVRTPVEVVLASGDAVHLDAGTAIIDDTRVAPEAVRRVRLLEGAAFFDVAATGKGFEVVSGQVTVEVVGTAFEVAQIGDAVRVTVAHGAVLVSSGAATVTLAANERARFGADGAHRIEAVETRSIAAWRENRLVTDGMEFAEAIRVIERRLPGRVVIVGGTRSAGRVTGGLDLNDPEQALRALAALRGGRVVSAVPGVFLLFPGE